MKISLFMDEVLSQLEVGVLVVFELKMIKHNFFLSCNSFFWPIALNRKRVEWKKERKRLDIEEGRFLFKLLLIQLNFKILLKYCNYSLKMNSSIQFS